MVRHLPPCKRIAELGVHRGDFSEILIKALKPEAIHLVDAWDAEAIKKGYCVFDELPPGVLPLVDLAAYFGGSPLEQSTLDNNFHFVENRFQSRPEVTIVRMDSYLASERYENEFFDCIYIDANHAYDYVLRDLKVWSKKLNPNGFIMLNDCRSNTRSRERNIGVLEAVTFFLKATHFIPVAFTNSINADAVISPPGNEKIDVFVQSICRSGKAVEIPDAILPNAQFNYRGNNWILSFA